MRQFEVTCLGTADGTPCADRNHSAYFYRFGAASLVVDCGDGVCRSLKAAGADFNGFDRVLLSHLHSDHMGGFFMLMQGTWLEKRRRALRAHLPAEGVQPIRRLMEVACLCDELLGFRLGFEPLRDRRPFRVKEVRVTPFLNTHMHGFRRRLQKTHPLPFESFSFLFETERFRVAHSADIGAAEDLAPLLEKPVDLLVCEMAHVSAEKLCAYLRGRPLRRVAFVHLSRPARKRFGEVRKLVRSLLPGVEAVYPCDGQTIGFRPASPPLGS